MLSINDLVFDNISGMYIPYLIIDIFLLNIMENIAIVFLIIVLASVAIQPLSP